MMQPTKKAIGKLGEELADTYLKQQGYKILERNYVTRAGEIDIVCRQKETVVFVEVKTRTSNIYGFPEEAITKTKARHLVASAFDYLGQHYCRNWRIDLITVELTNQTPMIKQWPNIIDENSYAWPLTFSTE